MNAPVELGTALTSFLGDADRSLSGLILTISAVQFSGATSNRSRARLFRTFARFRSIKLQHLAELELQSSGLDHSDPLMLERNLPGRETQVRLLRFLVVGGTAALVQFAMLALAKKRLDANLAFTLSFICSSLTHYALNRFWALPSERRDSWKQLGEYLLTVGISYVINIGLFRLCVDVISLSVMWSAVVALPPSTLVVFLLLNYRVFRRVHHDKHGS